MTEIIESVIFEGTLRRDTETSDWKVVSEGYGVEAITKPGTYTLIDSLPYDFTVVLVRYRITEEFDGTIELGTNANHSRIMSDTDFMKTVGKRAKTVSIDLVAGQPIRLYLGTGTTGKIELRIVGWLYNPSLL